jgi:hypothetical protein
MELTNHVPSRLEGPRGTTLIFGREEYSTVTYFLQNEFVRGPDDDSIIEDVKNIVYRPFALK